MYGALKRSDCPRRAQRRNGEGKSTERHPQKELQRSNGESEEAKRLPLSSDFYHDNYSRNQRATAIGATACTERRQQQSKPQHVRSADNSNRSHSMYIALTTAI